MDDIFYVKPPPTLKENDPEAGKDEAAGWPGVPTAVEMEWSK